MVKRTATPRRLGWSPDDVPRSAAPPQQGFADIWIFSILISNIETKKISIFFSIFRTFFEQAPLPQQLRRVSLRVNCKVRMALKRYARRSVFFTNWTAEHLCVGVWFKISAEFPAFFIFLRNMTFRAWFSLHASF